MRGPRADRNAHLADDPLNERDACRGGVGRSHQSNGNGLDLVVPTYEEQRGEDDRERGQPNPVQVAMPASCCDQEQRCTGCAFKDEGQLGRQ